MGMVNKYERTKRLVVMGYLSIVTLVLWGISNTDMATFSEAAFFRFAIFFWGGGFAFYYLSVLLELPATKKNWTHWLRLSQRILIAFLIIGGGLGLMLLVANVVMMFEWSPWIYVGVGISIFLIGIWLSIDQAAKFRVDVQQLAEAEH